MNKLDRTYRELMEKMDEIGVKEKKHQKKLKRIQHKRFLKAKRNYYQRIKKNKKSSKKKPYINKYKEAKNIKRAMEKNSIKTYHPTSTSDSSSNGSSVSNISSSKASIATSTYNKSPVPSKTKSSALISNDKSLKNSMSFTSKFLKSKSSVKSASNKGLTPLQKAEKKLKRKWQNY